MAVRMAAVAGQFYESSPPKCLAHIEQMLSARSLPPNLPSTIVAGIVPHAGWVFSGDLAGMVFAAIKQIQPVDTFVIFGAVHAVRTRLGILYDVGQWGTPLGTIDVDEPLAAAILDEGSDLIQADTSAHSREHSIEVQVPFIQHLFPEAKIVPLLVPPITAAPQIGRTVASIIQQQSDKNIVCIASTDLTHYGPSYGFTPMGTGREGINWAREKNDQFFIDQALTMQFDKIVESAQLYGNACGPGATAAAVAVALKLGCEQGILLAHTTSAQIMEEKFQQKNYDSVGYAAIIYGT